MQALEEKLSSVVIQSISSLFGAEPSPSQVQFQKTKKEFTGDITLVTFPLLKLSKTSPEQTSEKVGAYLAKNSDLINGYNVIKGFLNLEISDAFFIDFLSENYADENFGFAAPNSKPLMMVEYSSPNTNKPLHLGHLRNNFLGYSVSEILKANGHGVQKVQIINDRGIHICKSMLAWQRFGKGETPEISRLKGDKLVGKYYVAFEQQASKQDAELLTALQNGNFENENLQQQFNELEAQKAKENVDAEKIDKRIKDLVRNNIELMISTREMLKKWETKDEEIYALWEKMNGWVYDGFNETYKAMGVDFDKLYYESDTYTVGKEKVLDGVEKGVFQKREDGSVMVDLTDDGLDQKLLLRSDGTSLYMTQDIGTAMLRFEDFPDLDGIIYTVGNEQDYHFKVLFLTLEKLGYEWAKNCAHLSYGMVELPEGKMKSREGTVVDADDLIAEMTQSARSITEELGKLDGVGADEKETLYHQIGLAALKYFLLKVDPRKKMMFNPEESIDFNGNTGPFIQYAYARISSITRKYGKPPVMNSTAIGLHESEKRLLKQLVTYPEVIKLAGDNLSPAEIANYLYDLVKLFNQFYQSVSILKEPNEELLNMRVALTSFVGHTINSSLGLLGIHAPERM